MPEMDGDKITKIIKSKPKNKDLPILMLTAKSTDEDRALGLEVGADDYLAKPFHLPELLLRVKGILRRWEWYKPMNENEMFKFGTMWIDFATGKAKGASGELTLTIKEALIMKLLISKKDQVVSRDELLEKVWGYSPNTETRTVDNFIARLRKYFEKKPQKPKHILTVREKGYQFVA